MKIRCLLQIFEYSFYIQIWGNAGFDLLPNNTILDSSKLKGFADDKINVTKKLKYALGRVENKKGKKGENAGYQHFLFFSIMLSKGYFMRVVKSRNCVVKSFKQRYIHFEIHYKGCHGRN